MAARADVEINETTFPDENFRTWMLSQEYGADRLLTAEEIAGVTSIDVRSKSIQSLKGIEYFNALTMLICIDNQLTALDLSQNSMIDSLYCYNNQLTALEVSKNTELKLLSCFSNQLTALDVSKNTKLKELYCYSNQLTALYMSENVKLRYLYCSENQLTTLDVSENTVLTYLDCSANQLTALNISGCSGLLEIKCTNNQIKGEAMDAVVNAFPSSMFSNFFCVISNEDEHNEITVAQVATAYSRNWIPCAFVTNENGSTKRVKYPGIDAFTTDVVINEENFPDPIFRDWLLSRTYGSDGVLTTTELMDAGELYLYNMGIQSLKGLEFFVYTTRLNCSFNQLEELDVSQNILLTTLYCDYNQLTELDVSKNTRLADLRCASNQLTALDLSACTNLTNLYFYMNQIYGSAMDAIIEDLPTVTSGEMWVIYYKNEQNVMTKAQVATVKAKGWTPKYYNNGWMEYEGSDPVGISCLTPAPSPMRGDTYDLSGRHVNRIGKGIYIEGGRKVVN